MGKRERERALIHIPKRPGSWEAGSVLGFVPGKHRMGAGGCVGWCQGMPTQWLLLLLVIEAGPPAKVRGKRLEGRRFRKSTEHVNSPCGEGVTDLIGKRRQHFPVSLKSQESRRLGKYYAIDPHGPGLPWKRVQRYFVLIVSLPLPTSHHVHPSKLTDQRR